MPLINMPKLSDTMTEGTLVKWLKNEGDNVDIGDILAEVETDKATMEMEAFDEGILKEIYAKEGEKVKVGDRLALVYNEDEEDASGGTEDSKDTDKSKAKDSNDKVDSDDKKDSNDKAESAEKEIAEGAEVKASSKSDPSSTPEQGKRVKASPLARKMAKDQGLSLYKLKGTGPGGRIVAKDVSAGAETSGSSTQSPKSAAAPTIKPEKTGGEETVVPLSGMRRVIADRLFASKTQIPHFYLSIEVDSAPLMRLRKEVNLANEAAEIPKTTVNDYVLLAVAHACAMTPKVNAAWNGDSIIEYKSVNVCVAVAVEDGLVTPVIRDAQSLSLREISAAVKELANKARNKKLKPEDYQGGTITVSNLGAYGIEQFYAIVNPPQAAILAVGAIIKKPVVTPSGELAIGERMNISLSGDHRVVDGAVGAEFLGTLRKLLENPALMLL